MRRFSSALLAALAVLSLSDCSQSIRLDEESQASEAKSDTAPALPAFPDQGRLIKANLDEPFDYFIDPDSITIDGGAIWYTIVARSREGAVNIEFEGLRCRNRERKLYATGRSDGVWSLARNPQWESTRASYLTSLANYFFCPNGRLVVDAEEGVRALKSGRHPDTILPRN